MRLIASGKTVGEIAELLALSDSTIISFLDIAESSSKIKDPLLRAETAGTLQALVGLWQIFSRQGSIPDGAADAKRGKHDGTERGDGKTLHGSVREHPAG